MDVLRRIKSSFSEQEVCRYTFRTPKAAKVEFNIRWLGVSNNEKNKERIISNRSNCKLGNPGC